MIGTDHDDLIQGEIDGVNAPGDSARLDALVAASPGLAARFEALRSVSETLDRAERLDPPPGLADDVMAAIRRRPAVREPSGWIAALRGLVSPVPLAALACVLLLGVGLGAVLSSDLGLLTRSETASLSGTALPQGRLDRSPASGRRSFQVDGVRGEAATRLEAGLLVVDLVLEGAGPTGVSLLADSAALSPRAFSQDGPSGGEVVLAGREVRFTHAEGRCRYSISFHVGAGTPGTVRLRIGSRDGPVLGPASGPGGG